MGAVCFLLVTGQSNRGHSRPDEADAAVTQPALPADTLQCCFSSAACGQFSSMGFLGTPRADQFHGSCVILKSAVHILAQVPYALSQSIAPPPPQGSTSRRVPQLWKVQYSAHNSHIQQYIYMHAMRSDGKPRSSCSWRTDRHTRQWVSRSVGQSASLSLCQAPIWDSRPILLLLLFNCFLTVTGILMWGALSDEKSGLKFSVVAKHRQRSPSRSESRGTHEHNFHTEREKTKLGVVVSDTTKV
jgi:hypothetical protein